MVKRGKHPNSLANLEVTHKKSPRQRKQVKLMPDSVEKLLEIGDGSLSDGIDGLIAKLEFPGTTTFKKTQILLEILVQLPELPEIYKAQIESLLLELQDWQIEHDYQEAVTEGVIKPVGGAYII